MTNRHVVVGLTWDGYDIQRADFGVLLDIVDGLDDLPELRTSRQVIPFRHGQRAEYPYANGRPLVLSGLLDGRDGLDRAAYRTYVDEVKQSFSPFRAEPGILVATLEDGTLRWISAMPLDLRPASIVPGASRISIELLADDPFWYSAYGFASMDSGLLMDDGEAMDQGAELVVTPTTASHAIAFDTLGTADVERIRIQFTGPSVAAVGIEVDTTDGIVGFTAATLASGEELEVDNAARTALVGVLSQRQFMTLQAANRHGEYVRFRSGLNTVRILGQPAEVRILLTPTYL